MGLFVCRWGVCGLWTGEAIPPCRGLRYQSRKAVGRMESGCNRRVSGWWGLAFVPISPPGSPEKITEQADSSWFRALSSDWIWRPSRCWSCSRGFGQFQLLTLTPQDRHTAPAALTHNLLKQGPTDSQHTSLAWVTFKDRQTLRTIKACLFIKAGHTCVFPDRVYLNWESMNPLI